MPLLGQTIFNTDSSVLEIYDGVAWRSSLSVAMWKTPCRLATAAALPAYTRAANVLLANANGALPNIDGVAAAVGDRILVKDGAAGADNGTYVVDSLGGASAKWQMTRTEDANESAEVRAGLQVIVNEGTAYNNTVFGLATNDPITLNTTSLSFRPFTNDRYAQVSGSAFTTTSATFVDVTGLTAKLAANVNYFFFADLAVRSTAGTDAYCVSVNADQATNTSGLRIETYMPLDATGGCVFAQQNTLDAGTNTASSPGATTMLCRIMGHINLSAAGTMAIRARIAGGNTLTIQIGSQLVIGPVI